MCLLSACPHREGRLCALQMLLQFHSQKHGTAQSARSMLPAVRGPLLINSVVLACLLLACIERGGMVRVIPGRAKGGATGAR